MINGRADIEVEKDRARRSEAKLVGRDEAKRSWWGEQIKCVGAARVDGRISKIERCEERNEVKVDTYRGVVGEFVKKVS